MMAMMSNYFILISGIQLELILDNFAYRAVTPSFNFISNLQTPFNGSIYTVTIAFSCIILLLYP